MYLIKDAALPGVGWVPKVKQHDGVECMLNENPGEIRLAIAIVVFGDSLGLDYALCVVEWRL